MRLNQYKRPKWTEQERSKLRTAAKVAEKLSTIHCNKNLYSMVTSVKQPWTASYRPICFIPILNSQEDLKSGVFCQTKVKECGNVIVSLAFVNVMDSIITIIVLLFLHLHLFVLIFDKLKNGPRLTSFSGEPLLNGHLY